LIADTIRYGAVSGKLRAMYGRRLTSADFAHLKTLASVPDAAAFLKAHPAWRPAFGGAPVSDIRRGALENLLRESVCEEYNRIIRYTAPRDRAIMRFPALRPEMDRILKDLRQCADYRAFLENVRDSFFYAPLSALAAPDGSAPGYASADLAMHNYFYSAMLAETDRYSGGKIKKIFRRSAETQVDILNITRVFRLRKFFPGAKINISDYLFPFRFRVNQTFLEALAAAPDDETAFTLLKMSRYGKIFSTNTFNAIEDYCHKTLYDFNKRQFRSAPPTAYAPFAYLYLKEAELRDLISVIECIRYRVPPDKSPVLILH